MGIDRALLVGINRYPDAPLRGCINDIRDMAAFLHMHGFDDSEITLLADRRATTAAILSALKRFVRGARAGDRLFFQYSGHGVQVPTRNARQELDGLDEAICPFDFDWSEDRMITDKKFHEIFSMLPPGVEAIWVSDSCHSGDLDRGMEPHPVERPRFMLAPEDIAWDIEVVKRKKLQARSLGHRTVGGHDLNIALISGCGSKQTSADAQFGGRFNGALTYYLIKTLKAHPQMPLKAAVAETVKAIATNGYTQRPELVGPDRILGMPFFAGAGR